MNEINLPELQDFLTSVAAQPMLLVFAISVICVAAVWSMFFVAVWAVVRIIKKGGWKE